MAEDLSDQVASVGVLAEPARWALYRYVARAGEPVSRDQASAAVDLPLHSVKFHLDRLVEQGLLEVEYKRLTGRTGPGAGRPAKLYRRADRQVEITLPERRYDLAGDLLAAAVDRSMREGTPVGNTVQEVARAAGLSFAADVEETDGDEVDLVVGVLTGYGYEPRVEDGTVCLANCPFDRLAATHTELVCGMNLALITGVVDGLEATSVRPRLAPHEGRCCVEVVS
ncbi:MAG: helix-turn-helix domain-containing protein [Nocardioidaceae bacterium]|nr:helix-turn-helix domain-containing protein [Nocardioidaceae bacterium]